MKEMVGGCCVCSDERGWTENPLVYCDGQGCTVAVHQACYGIVTVPTGPWYCRKCESQERAARVRCELCPSRDGALKRTDNAGWAHVVCALYIPEVRFGNVTTMEPIILQLIPQERFNKTCYICQDMSKGNRASIGACMQCNKSGCRQQFHVTCAQALGLLCEEAGNYLDNVKYCGYCQHHYSKLKKVGNIKAIPPYKPISTEHNSSDSSPEKELDGQNATTSIIQNPMHQPKPSVLVPTMSKIDAQQSKISNRKSVSTGKTVNPGASMGNPGPITSNISSGTASAAMMKNVSVNLSKDKHITKPIKTTIPSKSSDKDKNNKVSKAVSSTSSNSSTSTTTNKTKETTEAGRKTPNTSDKTNIDKAPIKRDQKDNSKFTHSNFVETVVVASEPMFGDKDGLAIKLTQGQLKKRKADSRTSTPVPDSQLTDVTGSSNVIVTPMDIKDENHKKIKTEHSPSPPLQSDPPISGQLKVNTVIGATIPKTESISPLPPQNIQPTPITTQQPTSIVVSVPLSTASSAMSQMSNNIYQQLSREQQQQDSGNQQMTPVLNIFTDRMTSIDHRSTNSPSLNVMHSQTQSALSQTHQIGAVANFQSHQALGTNIEDESQTNDDGGGLKISFEKQVRPEETTKRSRSQTAAKAGTDKQRANKKRAGNNNKLNKQNNTTSTITPNVTTTTTSDVSVNDVTSSLNATPLISSTSSPVNIIPESSSGVVNDNNVKDNIVVDNQILQQSVNKRSSRSHTTTPPGGNTNAPPGGGSLSLQQNAVMGITPKESPSTSPSPDEQPKRKGRKPGNANVVNQAMSSPSPVPDSKQDIKLFQNGVHAPHMLGNQLNPNSNMAQKMSDHLNHEMEAHSVFSGDQDGTGGQSGALIGPALLRNTARSGTTPSTNTSTNPVGSLMSGASGGPTPQSLDQLLERQWEQGSQFLMEQAQHFDIASLLSCLHQLRTENVRLEDHVNSLVARRDHLLAVNARLAIPLTQPTGALNAVAESAAAAATRAMRPMVNNPTENGIVSQDVYRTQQAAQVSRHSPQQYPVNTGNIQQAHGNIRTAPRDNVRTNYQPYSVVTSQQQVVVRRDAENHLPVQQQKPPN